MIVSFQDFTYDGHLCSHTMQDSKFGPAFQMNMLPDVEGELM